MSKNDKQQPDIGPNNVYSLDAARSRQRNIGRNAVTQFPGSPRTRTTNAKAVRLFPDEEPDFSDDEVAELEDALTVLSLVSGHRKNEINKLLAELGRSHGDRAEREATVRIADFMRDNPKASFADIRAVILE